jgi:hypothetical protein
MNTPSPRCGLYEAIASVNSLGMVIIQGRFDYFSYNPLGGINNQMNLLV